MVYNIKQSLKLTNGSKNAIFHAMQIYWIP